MPNFTSHSGRRGAAKDADMHKDVTTTTVGHRGSWTGCSVILLEILRVTLHVHVHNLIGLTLMKAVFFQHLACTPAVTVLIFSHEDRKSQNIISKFYTQFE